MNDLINEREAQCPPPEVLASFDAGRLPDEQLEEIAAHLGTCNQCEEKLATLAEGTSVARLALHVDAKIDQWLGEPEIVGLSFRDLDLTASMDTADMGAVNDDDTIELPSRGKRPKRHVRVGQVLFNRYRVEKVLGKGTFGLVLKAHDEKLQRDVALKIPTRLGSRVQIQSFLQEARSTAKLNHPGIVAVHDFGEDESGDCYIAMEFVEGRTLADVLKDGKPDLDTAIEWTIKIAEAVQCAHQQEIVHRDLKPANIMIDSNNEPRVMDFGLALHEERRYEHEGEYAGTLRYMAPEQLERKAHYLDGRADIWAVGCILYEMLTGRPAFVGTEEQIIREIRERDPKPPSQLVETPPKIEQMILECLSKDVESRPSSCAVLIMQLDGWRQPLKIDRFVAAIALGVIAVVVIGILASNMFGQHVWRGESPSDASSNQPIRRLASELLERAPLTVFPKREQSAYVFETRQMETDQAELCLYSFATLRSESCQLVVKFRLRSEPQMGSTFGLFVGNRQVTLPGGIIAWRMQCVTVHRNRSGRVA